MTTIASLRMKYANKYLARADADTLPWTASDIDLHLGDAIRQLWPVHGLFVSGDVATTSAGMEYTVPASIARLSRIEILDTSGYYRGAVTNWRTLTSGKVVIKPVLAGGYNLRFWGWKAFSQDAADLPVALEDVVSKLAAAQAYGQLAAHLTNTQRQQSLDSGRMVDHQQAIALSAYWQRVAESRLFNDPTRVALAPRMAQRG